MIPRYFNHDFFLIHLYVTVVPHHVSHCQPEDHIPATHDMTPAFKPFIAFSSL